MAIESDSGEIFACTTILDAPSGFEFQIPYTIALVKLDGGPLVLAQITDLDEDAKIGMRVERVIRKLSTDGNAGIINYGSKFRPLLQGS